MNAAERRSAILKLLSEKDEPFSANALGESFGVSRQIIVQDIAALRASGQGVIATSKGYILTTKARHVRVFKCRHSFDEVVEECMLVVDSGGRMDDVFVNHRIYGKLSARLDVSSRVQVEELYRSLVSGASKPLMSVTDGFHYHTVTAESEQALDEIEAKLRGKGFLVEV